MPLDLEAVQPDFLYAAGYKWLLCPYGFSLLYVSERWRDSRSLEEVWMGRENAADFAGLVKYAPGYMSGARRFDVGEKCTPTILPGAIAAFEQLKAWSVSSIAASLAGINGRIAACLEELGFTLPPRTLRCPHMFGARFPERYKGNLVAELSKRNIYVSQRGNAVRFAPHLYVDAHDLDRLEVVLQEIVG
jgi:selenocysteine lyase/cysteine desulfurase